MKKPILLLLHGAIGSASQLKPIAEKLKDNFEIHTLNFSGHSGLPIPDEPFSIKLFADDVLNYLKNIHPPFTKGGFKGGFSSTKISIFGYSMGGYVALYLAKHYPSIIDKVFTIATKFNWSPEIAAKETAMLNPEKIQDKIPAFAKELQLRHSIDNMSPPYEGGVSRSDEGVLDNWKLILSKTSEMMTNLGNHPELTFEEMKTITCPVTISVGDSDKMVSIEETTLAHRSIPNAKLLILPNTPHPIEKIPLDVLISYINAEML